MSARVATQAEWTAIVERARAAGASPGSLEALEAGHMTFVTDAGEELSAPRPSSNGAKPLHSAPTTQLGATRAATTAKRWRDLTNAERHALWLENEDKARALRDADTEEN